MGHPERAKHPGPTSGCHARFGAALPAAVALATLAAPASAQPAPTERGQVILGFRVRAGGRYDAVRRCVATPAGVKGGPAADVSFFTEIGLDDDLALDLDLPVMRPLLFATAFDMVQFEPSASLRFRLRGEGRTDLVLGPTAGVSLHHGPDYRSENHGAGRRPSFWALGPILGAYVGADFTREGRPFNAQLGLTPYVLPLLSIDDPERHRGVVVGGLLDGSFRFATD